MFDFTSPAVVAGWAGAAVLLWLGCTLLFRMGCALADVAEPRLPRSALLVGLALAVSLPVGGLLVWLLGRYDPPDTEALFGPMRVVGLVLSCLAAWVLSGALYTLSLPTPYRKGLMISAFEMLLGALGAALLAGVVLVVLAVVQIARRPAAPPKTALAPPPALGAGRQP